MQIILEVYLFSFSFFHLKIKWKIGQVSYDGLGSARFYVLPIRNIYMYVLYIYIYIIFFSSSFLLQSFLFAGSFNNGNSVFVFCFRTRDHRVRQNCVID